MAGRLSSPKKSTGVMTISAETRRVSHTVSQAGLAVRLSIFSPRASLIFKVPLPKPIECRRKIACEVVSLQNSLMRPMPDDGVCLWGEIEHFL